MLGYLPALNFLKIDDESNRADCKHGDALKRHLFVDICFTIFYVICDKWSLINNIHIIVLFAFVGKLFDNVNIVRRTSSPLFP